MTSIRTFAEVPWLTPYPDRLLDEVAPTADEPDAVAVERETISLAFLAALQVLPPRQRATLIARDILDWPASETASALDTSVVAVNSALQRARATMQAHLPARRADWSAREPSAEERVLLDRFIEAHERGDAALAMSIASEDLRITMPPYPMLFEGLATIAPLARARPCREGEWRLVPDDREPAADSRELHAGAGRFDLPRLQVRCSARRGWADRGDHDLWRGAVPASSGSRRRSDAGAPTRADRGPRPPRTRSTAAASATNAQGSHPVSI